MINNKLKNGIQIDLEIEKNFQRLIGQYIGSFPEEIILDGQFWRFNNSTKSHLNKDCAYVGHKWEYKNNKYATISFIDFVSMNEFKTLKSWDQSTIQTFTEEEKKQFEEDFNIKLKEIKKFYEQEKQRKREEAKRLYEEGKEIKILPEYFKNKGLQLNDISPLLNDLRQLDDCIAYPLYDFQTGSEIVGIQRIYPNGVKRIQGCVGFYKIDKLLNNAVKESCDLSVVYICEGLATGLSVHLATNAIVYVANQANQIEKTLNFAISEIRELNENVLFCVAADKDFITHSGEEAAASAIKNKLGTFYTLPWIKDKKKQKALKSVDFDDLRQIEGLDHVREILNPQKLCRKFFNSLHEYKNSYVKFADSQLSKLQYLSNFIIELDYELKTDTGTVRFINLIGQKEKNHHIAFDKDIFATKSDLKKFVYKCGNYTIEDNLIPEEVKKHLINNKKHLFVKKLEKIGRKEDKFYFGNCALELGNKEPIMPEKGFFNNGYDECGNKKAYCLDSNAKIPHINLKIDKEEAKETLKNLISTLRNAYGFNAVIALACLISALFRKEIAECTESNQYPALYMCGDPKSGKSNLVNLLENLHGFNNSGLQAKSTLPSLTKLLTQRNSLITPIYEVKPKDMEKMEGIQQLAYDGDMRTKQKKSGNEWVSTNDKPKGFLCFDSNHLPSMESLIERIILIEFLKRDFKVNEARLINVYKNKLSAITRYIIQTTSLEYLVHKIFQLNSEYLSLYDSREALIAVYIRLGIEILYDFADLNTKDVVDEIKTFTENSRIFKQQLKIVDSFFNYFFHKWLEKNKKAQLEDIKHEYTIQLEGDSLFIASKFINQALQDFETEKKGLGLPSIKDIKDSISRASFCKNTNKNKRYSCGFSSSEQHKSYEFDLKDNSLPTAIKERYLNSMDNEYQGEDTEEPF